MMGSAKIPALKMQNYLSSFFCDFLDAVKTQNAIANGLMKNIALQLIPVQLRPQQCFHCLGNVTTKKCREPA